MTVQDVFEAVGAHAAGRMSDADFKTLEDVACPGAGACGGQFTANTMAIVCECLGISPLGSGSVPATDAAKPAVARRTGELAVRLAAAGLRPRDIITRRAIRERHRRRRRHRRIDQRRAPPAGDRPEAGVELSLARLRPHQREDAAHRRSQAVGPLRRHRAACRGRHVRSSIKRLVEVGCDRRQRSDRHRVARWPRRRPQSSETPGQEVVRPIDRPLKPTGGLVILFGNLAPEGAVLKLSGTERALHRGPARVFDSEEQAFEAVQRQAIKPLATSS